MNLTVTAATHPDHSEGTNQDAVVVKRAKTADGKDAIFVIVCDGMGEHGQSASASVANALNAWFEAFIATVGADLSPHAIFRTWDAVLKKMTKRLFSAFGDDGSCATVAMFLMVDNAWYMANIGDVRVYKISEEGAQLLSTDHTFAEREIALGHMDPIEAMTDPQAFCVLQAIGKTKDVVASTATGVEENGDSVFLVCTDGFYRKNRISMLYKDFRPDAMEKGYEGETLSKAKDNAIGSGETDDMSAVVIHFAAGGGTENEEKGGDQ